MRKFQVTIQFDMNDEFAALVPPHRTYINRLIEQGIIDHYVVTMETQRVWITAHGRVLARGTLHGHMLRLWLRRGVRLPARFTVHGKHLRVTVRLR